MIGTRRAAFAMPSWASGGLGLALERIDPKAFLPGYLESIRTCCKQSGGIAINVSAVGAALAIEQGNSRDTCQFLEVAAFGKV